MGKTTIVFHLGVLVLHWQVRHLHKKDTAGNMIFLPISWQDMSDLHVLKQRNTIV